MNSEYVTATFRAAVARERKETLDAGIPIFYRDPTTGMNIMEQPGGRRYEIRFRPGVPRDRHYEVIREISRDAA
jgi:hypothetical protein